jgi:hypothetical protein
MGHCYVGSCQYVQSPSVLHWNIEQEDTMLVLRYCASWCVSELYPVVYNTIFLAPPQFKTLPPAHSRYISASK